MVIYIWICNKGDEKRKVACITGNIIVSFFYCADGGPNTRLDGNTVIFKASVPWSHDFSLERWYILVSCRHETAIASKFCSGLHAPHMLKAIFISGLIFKCPYFKLLLHLLFLLILLFHLYSFTNFPWHINPIHCTSFWHFGVVGFGIKKKNNG